MQTIQQEARAFMKQRYTSLCCDDTSIPIFSQPWWLDATAGPFGWDVALVEKGGVVVASMPYMVRRRLGFSFSVQPKLTQCLGPWLRRSESKVATRLAMEKDLMQALIDQLPDFVYFSQNWHRTQTNWLPFFWRGFQQTTRYTYVLSDLEDQGAIWAGLDESIRREIRKASGRHRLRVRDDLGIDEFLPLNAMVFARQGKRPPYSEAFVRNLDDVCKTRGRRMILIAEDEQGRRHAGVYIIWDATSAYYLMGGGDPELRRSGATSLCLWEAIKRASELTKAFDFEGSMIEPVEKFFRSFGAEQVPYFNVRRAGSKAWQALTFVRSLRQVHRSGA